VLRLESKGVNPDQTTASASIGGGSCDLTGNDWGYAVDPAAGTIDRGNACSGGTGIIPFNNQLHETGGSQNGSINNITVPEVSGSPEATTLTLTAEPAQGLEPAESICFGSGCDDKVGDTNSTLDPDNLVNQTGDEMTGSLHIHKFKLENPDSDICIGAGTSCSDPSQPSGEALGSNNTDTEPDFILDVNTVRPLEQSKEGGDGTLTFK